MLAQNPHSQGVLKLIHFLVQMGRHIEVVRLIVGVTVLT
jgi:hypothetical protein